MHKISGGRKRKIKNRNDVRYLRIQSRLDREIANELKKGHVARLRVPDISRRAKIWESTFYDHFFHLDDALSHFNHKMKPALKKLADEAQKINYNSEIVFAKILYFIYSNRGYYKTVVRCHNSVAILEISEVFRPIITKNWSNYNSELNERSFLIFSWELGGLICYWSIKEGFDKNKIGEYASYLAKLAHNATRRLNYA